MRGLALRLSSCSSLLFLASALGSPVVRAQDCQQLGPSPQFADGFEPGAGVAGPAFVSGAAAGAIEPPLIDLPGLSPLPESDLAVDPAAPPAIPSAHAPSLTAVASGAWQNPTTWGGRLPRACDVLRIPRGIEVELSGASGSLNGLWVEGTLRFGAADVELASRYIVVSGRLLAGTEQQPYRHRGEILLFGRDRQQSILGMGSKGILVVRGGLLKLLGERRLAWTRLDEALPAASTMLTTADLPHGWRRGDRLLLVAGGYDPREAEPLTLTAVNGSRLEFTPPLRHARHAVRQTVEGRSLDQRPVLGLLSRNLRIRGVQVEPGSGFGGHVMSMPGAHLQISGVEFEAMGQRGIAARYPVHWHIAGERAGNYLIAASIHNSFQRAAVIHSTHRVLLDANFAYDISNHAFVWAEDGDEFGNRLTRNVGALVRSPAPAQFAFPLNNPFHGNTSQDEHRSSVFWGRSFDRHLLRGNVSAGALDGFGYFFDLFSPAPFGGDEGGGLVFEDNTAHSTYKTLATGNQINYPEATTGHGLMVSTGASGQHAHVFSGYRGYHNVSGAWLEDRSVTLRESVLADNGIGVLLLRATLEDSVVVGDSAHPLPVQPASASVSTGLSAGINIAGSNHGGKRAPRVRRVSVLDQAGAAVLYDLDNISPLAEFEALVMRRVERPLLIHAPINFEFPDPPVFGLLDRDGSLSGRAQPTRLMRADAALVDARCLEDAGAQAFACPAADSLVLGSDHAFDLVDEDGALSHLRRFSYDDPAMLELGAVSLIGSGRRYQVEGPAVTGHDLSLQGEPGRFVELEFAVGAAPTELDQDVVALAAAVSLAALRSSSSTAYFHDALRGSLHLRIRASGARSSIRMRAPFVARAALGRAPQSPPAGRQSGFRFAAVAAGLQDSRLRYPPATGAALRSGVRDAARVDPTSTAPILQPMQNGELSELDFWLEAPASGRYRIGLWGNGGGTSVHVGDRWVNGESWAFINSNWVLPSGELSPQVVAFQNSGTVQLQAGWHRFTVQFGRFPQNTQGRFIHLRWATPQQPDRWVYPSPWRAP